MLRYFQVHMNHFGIVALEAMLGEIPVVVSDVGGLNEIVEHRNNRIKIICW